MLFSPYFVVVRVPVVEERPQQTFRYKFVPQFFSLAHKPAIDDGGRRDSRRSCSSHVAASETARKFARKNQAVGEQIHARFEASNQSGEAFASRDALFRGRSGRRRRRRREERREERRSRDEEKDETTTRTRTRTPNGDTDVVPFPKR